VNLEDGIKKQRKLLALIHDASLPCNPGYYDQRNELPVYMMSQDKYDALLRKFDEQAAELWESTVKKKAIG
jgi:hypothetical protein